MGVRLTMNTPYQESNPVMVADKPWETGGLHSYNTVMREGDIFRMWYDAITREKNGGVRRFLCYNGTGKIFSGVSFICDPRGCVIAESSTTSEEMVVADLKADDLAKARAVTDGFFRHFRRPEIYDHQLSADRRA